MNKLTPYDLDCLREARQKLENPGLTARITEWAATPVERGLALLPEQTRKKIDLAAHKAMESVVSAALVTMDEKVSRPSRDGMHRSMAIASGAIGGAFGLPGLIVELPVSISIIMRSILDIARSHGEELSTAETQLNALMVFALEGGDLSDSSYLTARAALDRSILEVVQDLASRRAAGIMVDVGAPTILRLIAKLASRFSIPLAQKAAAQLIPIAGAASGAMLNSLFINHFQEMAQGHFTVRRLERKYSPELIDAAYRALEL